MKVFGQLEKAQLENTTSDTASHPKGMITYRTDLNQAKVSNGTGYKLLIDEDSTQTLSNKTYASPSITGALNAAQTATPANPSSGENKLYFKADGKLYTLDAAGNEAMVGSGTGGVKNLITNGNADDTSSSIFVPYADAAATRPADGTGGSPTVTTSMTTSTPLDGVKSFLLTKPASNVQGQGWSVPFTVDPAYRAKALKISIDYIVNSGTFVAGSNTTESDIIWYLYDVTNSQLIEPSNIKMFSKDSSISDKFEATFQSSSTGSSYRLIAHVQSVSALAYELKVDNVTVSPHTYVFGSPVTDFGNNYAVTTSITTNATIVSKQRRVGDSLHVSGRIIFTGANTQAGEATISLPTSLSIDANKMASSIRTGVGSWTYRVAASGAQTTGGVVWNGATRDLALLLVQGSTNTPVTIANNDTISFDFMVPITGWSSSVQMSDSADTRVCVAKAVANPSNILSASPTVMNCPTKVFDTHGAYNTTTGVFTVPVSGYYRCSAFTEIVGTEALDQVIVVNLYKNGSTTGVSGATRLTTAGVSSTYAQATGTVYANAGDTLDFRASTSITTPAYSAANIGTSIEFERITGPSAIAANETIALRYSSNSGQTLEATGSGEVMIFEDVDYDTHGAYNSSTGIFTAPATGFYQVCAGIALQDAAWTSGDSVFLDIRKNSSTVTRSRHEVQASNTVIESIYINDAIYLVAGQTLDLFFDHNRTGGNVNSSTTSADNFLSIKRIGL